MTLWRRLSHQRASMRCMTFILLPILVVLVAVMVKPLSGSRLAAAQGRTCEVLEHDVPKGTIEIRSIENLQSSGFPRAFAVELKNISNKPIYYIEAVALFPDTKSFLGRPLGIKLTYGPGRLVDNTKRAQSGDNPIAPQRIFTITTNPAQEGALQGTVSRGDFPMSATNKVILGIQVINFGDGTGFIGSTPYNDSTIANSKFTVSPASMRTNFASRSSTQVCANWHKVVQQPCADADPETCKPEVPQSGGPPDQAWCTYETWCWSPSSQNWIYCNQVWVYNCYGPPASCW